MRVTVSRTCRMRGVNAEWSPSQRVSDADRNLSEQTVTQLSALQQHSWRGGPGPGLSLSVRTRPRGRALLPFGPDLPGLHRQRGPLPGHQVKERSLQACPPPGASWRRVTCSWQLQRSPGPAPSSAVRLSHGHCQPGAVRQPARGEEPGGEATRGAQEDPWRHGHRVQGGSKLVRVEM